VAQARYRDDITELLGESSDEAAVTVGRTLLNVRTIAATIAVTGRIIRNAAAADARPVWARVLGRRLPDTGAADWVMPETVAVAAITKGFLATRAVVLRKQLCGRGSGWRSRSPSPMSFRLSTGSGWCSVRCRYAQQCADHRNPGAAGGGGTAVGFVLGAVVIELLGVDPVVLWILLPIVAFGSAYVPRGRVVRRRPGGVHDDGVDQLQPDRADRLAGGTDPRRGRRGGALVGIVVSVLLWPRGATATVSKAIEEARAVGAKFLKAAVLRVTRGASEDATDRVIALSHER